MNHFVSVKSIAREVLPRLIDNLVFPNLIYRDYSSDVARGMNDSVLVRKPAMLEALEFNRLEGIEMQDLYEDTVEVALDKLATVDVSLAAWENATEQDLDRTFYTPAAVALAEKINRDGLELYKDVWQFAGTAGEPPKDLAAFADASYAMDVAKVPSADRRAVWSPAALANFRKSPEIVSAEKTGTTTALRNGSIGRIFGIENYMSQAVVHHTAGKLAQSLADGITLTVKEILSNDDSLVRLVLEASANVLNKGVHTGDILQIGGVNYVAADNNISYGTTIEVDLDRYFMGETGDSVSILPSHDANLVFHPHAFAFVTRPLNAPAGVESYVTTYNGISLRVTRGYDMRYKREMLSMDVLYGFKTVYPELAVRYMG